MLDMLSREDDRSYVNRSKEAPTTKCGEHWECSTAESLGHRTKEMKF